MALSLDEFVQRLTDSGLLSVEIAAYIDTLPADQKPTDGEALAKKLVADKQLTRFQAQQVWKGKTKGKGLSSATMSSSTKLVRAAWAWSSKPAIGLWNGS